MNDNNEQDISQTQEINPSSETTFELAETKDHFEELIKQIQHPKKRAFLDNFARTGRVNLTALAIGVERTTVYAWRKSDEVFSEALSVLKEVIDLERKELYEAELDRRALGDTSKMSDILLMFGLKALDPKRYRDKVTEHLVGGTIIVRSYVPRPDYSQIEAKEVKELEEGKGDATEQG